MAAVEARAEKLIRFQQREISRFFGAEVPTPPDQLFGVLEKIGQEKLFNAEPFYLPRRRLAQDSDLPGQKYPLDPWLYDQIRAGRVDKDADSLPEGWILMDVTRRPNYNGGKQMYPDSPRFREILASLREQGKIQVPDFVRHVPKDSRFAVSADEVDGRGGFVAKAVSDILGLNPDEVTTPQAAVFNYIGNLAHLEFGDVNTWELFADNFGRGGRLHGGYSGDGGLSDVRRWDSDDRYGFVGFRLQVAFPSRA